MLATTSNSDSSDQYQMRLQTTWNSCELLHAATARPDLQMWPQPSGSPAGHEVEDHLLDHVLDLVEHTGARGLLEGHDLVRELVERLRLLRVCSRDPSGTAERSCLEFSILMQACRSLQHFSECQKCLAIKLLSPSCLPMHCKPADCGSASHCRPY